MSSNGLYCVRCEIRIALENVEHHTMIMQVPRNYRGACRTSYISRLSPTLHDLSHPTQTSSFFLSILYLCARTTYSNTFLADYAGVADVH